MEPWPENAAAAEAFFALETQWRWNTFSGHRLGLDYGVIGGTLDLMGCTEDRALVFAGLRVMERAALETFRALKG